MSEADALVYDSEYMETWIPTVLKTLSDSKVKPISATKIWYYYQVEEEEHVMTIQKKVIVMNMIHMCGYLRTRD